MKSCVCTEEITRLKSDNTASTGQSQAKDPDIDLLHLCRIPELAKEQREEGWIIELGVSREECFL